MTNFENTTRLDSLTPTHPSKINKERQVKIVIAVLLLLCQVAPAAVWCAEILPSSVNITTTFQNVSFGTTAPITQISAVSILNTSATKIYVNCATNSTVVAPTITAFNIPVPAGSPFNSADKAGFGKACWVKSSSGTISSATTVYFCVTGN